MEQPQPPADFEITEVIRAEMNLRMHQLSPERGTTLFGPRTEAQRLIELEMVFASVKSATRELRARGYWHGIVLISLDGQRFWYLPFSLFPSVVSGLPADGLETLSLVEQISGRLPGDEGGGGPAQSVSDGPSSSLWRLCGER